MSETEIIEQARAAVERILSALGVNRVVCVDDTYEDAPSLEDVLAACSALPHNTLLEILPELGETIPEDTQVLSQQIRTLWNEFGNEDQTERIEQILTASRLQDREDTYDLGDASILSELIPEELLVTLSPKQWDERQEKLLEENSNCRTLFLFDQDLSEAGGDVQGGIKIIASLLARTDTGNLICGLLTHTVTPVDHPEKWEELCQTHNISRDHCLIVPKLYLSQDPVFFAQRLKFIALSPDFSALKAKTKEIIAKATEEATTQVDNINIYDIDHIVFRVSAEEGLWEPDMLFRLHALFHRLESRRLAHKQNELEDISRRLRLVSNIPTQTQWRPESSTWKLQQQELYVPGEYLNQYHLPLELGDIFTKTGAESTKYYILLAQPCDLMVRSNGKRQPELAHVPLIEIASSEELPGYAEEMPYFDEEPEKKWFVKFKQTHQVKTCVLDLCILNDKGTAKFSISGKPPEGIRPSWAARHAIMKKAIKKTIKPIELMVHAQGDSTAAKRTKDALRPKLSNAILNEGLFKGKITEEDGQPYISYNCRRTGRLTRARAFALLMSYTSCLTRPAFERDFGYISQIAEGAK